MKKRNQGILRQGKGLTSAVLITIMLLTGSLHGWQRQMGLPLRTGIPCTGREFDGRRKENRHDNSGRGRAGKASSGIRK